MELIDFRVTAIRHGHNLKILKNSDHPPFTQHRLETHPIRQNTCVITSNLKGPAQNECIGSMSLGEIHDWLRIRLETSIEISDLARVAGVTRVPPKMITTVITVQVHRDSYGI